METNRKVPWTVSEAISLLVVVALVTNFATYFYSVSAKAASFYNIFLFASFLQTALIFLGIFTFLRWKYRFPISSIGLHTTNIARKVFKGLGYGILLFCVVVLAGIVLQTIFTYTPQEQPFARLLLEAKNEYQIVVLAVFGILLAPLGEELLFRGFIYRALRNKTGIFWANLISAVLFSALHFDPFRFIPLTLGGMALAWVYENTGSLFSSIAAHGAWNAAMMGLLIFGSYSIPS